MPAAARVGDLTAHGTPLTGVGAMNVSIGGFQAWLAGRSSHFCPVVDGTRVHGSGLVLSGSDTVFIEGAPAVRRGDSLLEAPYTDEILSGDETVLIG